MTSSISKHIFLLSDPLDLGIDDDQHDYDSVASDEDTDSELTAQNNNNTQRSNRAKVRHSLTLCEELIYICHMNLKNADVLSCTVSAQEKLHQLGNVDCSIFSRTACSGKLCGQQPQS